MSTQKNEKIFAEILQRESVGEMKIGDKIKTARKKAGLTQKALGERCQMPDSQIRQYELGMVTPKIEQIQRIATALKCDITDLLSLTEAMPRLRNELQAEEPVSNLQKYLESIGYLILREEITKTIKKGYINFELSEQQQEMLNKNGYIMISEKPYYIRKDSNVYRLTEKQFQDMEKEVISSIEFQLWKYRSEENTNNPE